MQYLQHLRINLPSPSFWLLRKCLKNYKRICAHILHCQQIIIFFPCGLNIHLLMVVLRFYLLSERDPYELVKHTFL